VRTLDDSKLYDLALERFTLGACLLRPELLLQLDLNEADFYSPAHVQVWRSLLALHADGEPVNTLSLRSRLFDSGRLQAAGGEDFLLSLTDVIPPDHLPTASLKRLTRLRAIQRALFSALARVEAGELEETITAIAGVHAASLEGASRKSLTKNVLELYQALLEDLARPDAVGQLLHPGYEVMRRQLGMVPIPSTFGLLADTNVGKSTLGLEMLVRMAQGGTAVGYISVEDQEPRVRARLAGMLSGVSSQRILQRSMSYEETNQLYSGYDAVERLKPFLHVSVMQGGSELDVCAAMTELAQRGCLLVIADYLQKMRPANSFGGNRAHGFSDIATAITSHSQKLGMCLGLVSQMSRDKNRQNECPGKHDMKESGDLENMLDVVIGLWREKEDDHAPIWARLIKAKDGGVGKSWSLVRDAAGRLHEVEGSDRMEPPDRGEWSKKKRGGGYGQ